MSDLTDRAALPAGAARQLGRMLAIFGLLGVLAGLAAVGFVFLVDLASEHLLRGFSGLDPTARGWGDTASEGLFAIPSGDRLWIAVLPAFGGLLAGLICTRFAPEALGTGTARVIDAYHRHSGLVRARVPVVKAIASALTIGSGGSAGVEGPIGLIAGGLGALLARPFKLSAAERRVLLMGGFAAGIGAIFHAPMAASIFAAEVLYRELDIEHEVLVPAIIASTVAYGVFGAVHGWEPVWLIPPVGFDSVLELLPYTLLAVVCASVGAAFVLLYREVRRRLGTSGALPIWIRPAIGGLGVGVIGLVIPQALGASYGIAQIAIDSSVGIGALVVLAGAKMLTSALTAGSGGSGGLFGPSLVIGAALGGAVGQLFAGGLIPGVSVQPAAFAVVGMAGFFSTVISAPLSTVIMVSEVAGNYHLLVPTLWVCVIAWFLNRHMHLFSEQVRNRLDAPGHLTDMMDAVLRRITVREALNPDRRPPMTVPPHMPLRELVRLFASTAQEVFPIVEPSSGRVHGVVDGRALRRTVGEVGIDDVLIARDFEAPAVTARPSETLYDAVSRMTASGYDAVVVVGEEDDRELVALLPRRDVISAYHRRMLERAPGSVAASASGAREGSGLFGGLLAPPDLYEAIRLGGVLYGLTADTAEGALAEMIDKADLPPGCDRARLLELVVERERLSSTNIGDGIALPHPQTDDLEALGAPRVLLGLLRRPVSWDSSDAPPVETVCMLLAPSGPAHLSLLGSLARCLTDPALRRLLHNRAARKHVLARVREVVGPRSDP